MQRVLMTLGALAGFTAVAMASAAAHAFYGLPETGLQLVRTALQIHGWHALALLACALWFPRGGRWTVAAGWCFAAGLIIFCGEVYGLALGWWHIPMAAPVGGSLLLLGWLALGLGASIGCTARAGHSANAAANVRPTDTAPTGSRTRSGQPPAA